jgi:hypothetical protein
MREDTDPAANLAAEDGSGEDADDDLDLDPGFDAAEGETQDDLKAAIAEALDAQGPEEFFARLLGSVGRLAARPAHGTRRQSARGRRRGARPALQEGASSETGTRGSLTGVMRRLGRYLAEGIDEGEALDDLTWRRMPLPSPHRSDARAFAPRPVAARTASTEPSSRRAWNMPLYNPSQQRVPGRACRVARQANACGGFVHDQIIEAVCPTGTQYLDPVGIGLETQALWPRQ